MGIYIYGVAGRMNSNFKNIFQIELNKAFRNRYTVIAFILAVGVTLLSTFYMMPNYTELRRIIESVLSHQGIIDENPYLPAFTLYVNWIGGESYSIGFTLYFFLLPVFAALPYGWSFYQERISGYQGIMVSKCGRSCYYTAKFLSVFLTGGAVTVLPMLFNLFLMAMLFPAWNPDSIYPYFGMTVLSSGADFFMEYPFIFFLIYLAFDFLFSGLLALLCVPASYFLQHNVSVVLFPFTVLIILHFCTGFVSGDYEWSPIYFLHPLAVRSYLDWRIVLAQTCLLAGYIGGIICLKGRKDEFL